VTYLRLPSRPPTTPSPGRPWPHRLQATISLGRAIVAFYIVTLLTAVISARTLAENELSHPGLPEATPYATAPPVAGD